MQGIHEIATAKAPKAIGPYSQAVAAGPFVFVSGQLGLDPGSGEFAGGGVEAQARQALKNLGAVLAEAGLEYRDVAKTTIFLSDMADFPAVNQVYAEFFEKPYPARSTVAVKTLPKAGLVEIEAVALSR